MQVAISSLGGQLVAGLLGGDEGGEHVVARLRAALGDELAEIGG